MHASDCKRALFQTFDSTIFKNKNTENKVVILFVLKHRLQSISQMDIYFNF